MEIKDAIHYLRVLHEGAIVFEPDIRKAIDFAIEKLEKLYKEELNKED